MCFFCTTPSIFYTCNLFSRVLVVHTKSTAHAGSCLFDVPLCNNIHMVVVGTVLSNEELFHDTPYKENSHKCLRVRSGQSNGSHCIVSPVGR